MLRTLTQIARLIASLAQRVFRASASVVRARIQAVYARVPYTIRTRIEHIGGRRIAVSLLVLVVLTVFWGDIARFLGIGVVEAETYQMQTGYYIGDGGSQEISGLGFSPELVIIKADDASGVGAIFKTTAMAQNVTAYLSGATADDTAGLITLTADGFRVSGANANTANARFTWIAFTGSDCSATGQFCVGSYTGNGAATQAITSVGFSPDLVWVKRSTAVAPNWRSVSMPNNYAQFFAATTQDTTGVYYTTLDATGFTVGLTNNTNAGVFYYVAFQEVAGVIDVGTYTGNASDNTNIGGVGFVPDFVFVKNANAGAAVAGVYNVNESYGDSTSYFSDTAAVADSLQLLQNDGFQVGTHATANGNTNTLYYAAFGGAADHSAAGSFATVSGYYTGTGNPQVIGNLPFAPDLVIIKASTTQAGVFRTSVMAGDSTAYLDSATANLTGAITALNPTSFTVGTAAQVNTAGVTYYWTAYGNAWHPETNSGAADFTVGAYYGMGATVDNRDVTRIPFAPDFVAVKRSGATAGVWRTSEHVGDLSSFYSAAADAADHVQALNADGFEIGASANVNTAANLHWYFAFATGTNFAVGTYSGTGAVQNIPTTLEPDHLWVKSTGATRGVLRTSDFMATTSAPFINVAPITGAVTQMYANAFTVGTAAEANTLGVNNYRYAAWHTNSATTAPQTYAMQTGAYMGNGGNKKISGLGFSPELVIIKSDSNTIATIFKTSAMAQGVTAYMGAATADGNFIKLEEDGFSIIGTANSSNVSYTWTAFAGSDCSSTGVFCVGSYTGNGVSPRAITSVGFQPDLVWVKQSTAVDPNWRSSSMPVNYGQYFSATLQNTAGALFTTLDAAGFTVGATNNTNAATYYFVAFKEVAGSIDVGTYTGNAVDGTSITNVGFQPDMVFLKNADRNPALAAAMNQNESNGDSSHLFTATANAVDHIQKLESDGFQVGANNVVNGSGNTLYYAAFGGAVDPTPTGTFVMKTGSYTGTGAARTIDNLGFSPDLVIIKASTTQAGAFRSRAMAGDVTAYLDSATTNFTGGVTALNPDGFALGTAAQVNSAGVTYYYTAYGNAWNPDTGTGAADFTVGVYYGNGLAGRTILRQPFTPDLVAIKRSGATGGVWRTSEHVGDLSSYFAATAEAALNIQSIDTNGFTVGTTANVNTAANLYWYFSFATGTNFMVGSYSGNGTTQDVSTTFAPDYVWVKSAAATRGVERTSYFTGSTSAPFINVAPIYNAVTGFSTSSFSVGSAAEANTGATTYRYAAWRSYELDQMHYHWRNDDGSEAAATSATGGVADTAYTGAREGVPIRLRVEVSNENATTSIPTAFRLEYGLRNGSCAAVTEWTRVGDPGGAWDMYDTANLTDGDDTTNIAEATGGVTDENTTFLTPNSAVQDVGDEVSALTLLPTNFVELEYALAPTSAAVDEAQYCFRVTDAGVPLSNYTVFGEAQFTVHLFATSTGSQVSTIDVPGTNVHIGGAFVIQDLEAGPAHTVTDLTLSETGTVDASSSLDNIKVFYEYDTSAPYDCASESYDGTEAQFGVTDTDGFSAADGTASFAGSVNASTTQSICFYPVMDVLDTALSGQTINLTIATTAEDVIASAGDMVRGADPVEIASSTLLLDDLLTQTHYHVRNDDGNEAGASSATAGVEDTEYMFMEAGLPKRLRVQVSNEGATTSPAVQYRLEYGVESTACSDVSVWTDVGAVGGEFDMYNSTNLTDGTDTTNIAEATGGVTDENTSFRAPNGGVKDTSSQTSGITLTSSEFVELEYAIDATLSAAPGTTYCFRVTDAGTPLKAYSSYAQLTMKSDVVVSALGTQEALAVSPGSDVYLGGAFVIREQTSSRTVTGITLTENGSVDAQADLSDVRLYYDLDTSAPYNCVSESYDGGESLFGSATSSFSGPNGTAVFVGSANITTTATMCVYPVVDVDGTANALDTIDVEISNAGSQVLVSSGSVNPNTVVAITGSTTIEKAQISQTHYHFRNDDGGETDATSATGGTEDTPVTNRKQGETVRLRLEASKGGTTASAPTAFGLEYAERVTTCDAIGSWTPIETPDGAWALSDTANLTDGDDTTDIAVATGGVTDSNSVFKTPNGGVRDTSGTTSPITLLSTNYVDIEFAIEPTDNATFGSTYCFRLVGNGAEIDTYSVYPQATIQTNQDFYIQRGVTTIGAGSATASITAGAEYTAPAASTSAFIRITNAMHTGAGINSGGGNQSANNVMANISNASNIENSVTFTREGTTGNTRIYWEIVEYVGPTGGDNEIKVRQQGQLGYGATASTATTTGADGVVSDSDIVVFITGQRSPSNNTTNYHQTISTAAWNAGDDTASFTRGATGDAVTLSYAIVEFTGVNWKIQRVEHTHGTAGANETENIAEVNDLSRAFLHTQKRVGVNQVDEFGHQVWLSSVGQVTFSIISTAASPGTHVSVAWVIENTQTNGNPMVVTRSNYNQVAGGVEPSTYSIAIGKTLDSLSESSIFFNMWGAGNTTAYPRPIMGATIASTTHYELWISDTGSSRDFRTEIVEWPTAVLTFEQNYYQWYDDNDALDPTDLWPPGGGALGDNESITALDSPPTTGDVLRMRMTVKAHGSNIARETKRFRLQFGERTTPSCGAITTWLPVGEIGSTTAVWRGYNGTPLDGTALSTDPPTGGDLNVTSVADVAGTYEEENDSALNPYRILMNEDVEYDWVVEANTVTDATTYCFRMVEDTGTPFATYTYWPTLTTAGFEVKQKDWRWYTDESSITPSSALAGTNTAPMGVAPNEVLKLRVLLDEVAGKTGTNVKFKLQYSEFSNFSVVEDVVEADSCVSGSRWCYGDGAGTDNATITDTVLYGGDPCAGGVGAGCGTHNEYPYAPDIVGEVGTTTVSSAGTTINLQHTYDDPIYIVEAISGDASGGAGNRPAAAIITATTTSSFDVRIQEPDDEADTHGTEVVAYVVMERGAYQLPDGRRVDVGSKRTSNYYGNAVGGASDDTCTFTQTFSAAPVVLTALQTKNNTGTPDFLTASQVSITATDFGCSIEVPDGGTIAPTLPETIGWIAIEPGQFGNAGIDLIATTTSTSITGWTDTPWYDVTWVFEYFAFGPGIVASKQTRNGAEGGWVRYDNEDADSAQFAIDEADGGNRTHTTEKVGYLAFSRGGVLYRAGASNVSFEALATKEYEFTIMQKDAQVGQTYFFRLYDVGADMVVATSTLSTTNPSIVAQSGAVTYALAGIESGSSTEGVVTDVTTTPTSIPFGSLNIGTPKTAAQRLVVTTNAGQGYQILAYERQDLTAGIGATIDDITGTNSSPLAWNTGCDPGAVSCFGYHAGDNTLAGGSMRFLINDTFAALTGTMSEVAYSSGPVTAETTDVVYRVRIGSGQEAGRYETKVVYIIVPVF